MQLCNFDSERSRWDCGSGSGDLGADVLNTTCRARGDFIYAGCSDANWRQAGFGNCGGDPNKQDSR